MRVRLIDNSFFFRPPAMSALILQRPRDLVVSKRRTLHLPPIFPTVTMQYHRQAVRSLSILQFVFHLVACDGSTARLTATLSAPTSPQARELRVRQTVARKQFADTFAR
jgi:hypothetical protein